MLTTLVVSSYDFSAFNSLLVVITRRWDCNFITSRSAKVWALLLTAHYGLMEYG
jgi:hypothetical protein